MYVESRQGHRAISRSLNSSARSRSTSRIFRMDNLSRATLDPLSKQKGVQGKRWLSYLMNWTDMP
jgi:hypothetical protein